MLSAERPCNLIAAPQAGTQLCGMEAAETQGWKEGGRFCCGTLIWRIFAMSSVRSRNPGRNCGTGSLHEKMSTVDTVTVQ